MALVKISDLPAVGAAALTDILPEVQPPVGGTTFKVSLQQILTLFNANIQIAESQVTNLTTDLASKLNLSGGTMTGDLILNGAPTVPLQAADKAYVDAFFPVSLARGGTNASLTASNGGIFYSTATAGAILAGTASANHALLSGSATAPSWSSATYPNTTTINQLLYSSGANFITGLATANSAVLVTSSGGVPSISSTLPAGLTIPGYALSGANADITSMTGLTGKLQAPTAIASSTGANVLGFNYTASAVNYIQINNAATAGIPSISAVGSDSAVNLLLTAKGGGFFLQDSSGGVGANLLFFNGANTNFTNLKIASAQATNLTLTLPSVDGSANFVMKTDGTGVLSFASAGTLITQPTRQTFSSGSGTYTTPANVRYIRIRCWGAGGGGGGCTSSAGQSSGGGGGAGGGYVEHIINSPAATYSYAVGTGGNGGTAGTTTGTTGGSTTFSTLTASGGTGGAGGASLTGGVAAGGGTGGTGTGGNILNASAQRGGVAFLLSATVPLSGAGSPAALGSNGGFQAGSTGSGSAGASPGGGGSGACSQNGGGAQAGFAGANGYIVVEEYYA